MGALGVTHAQALLTYSLDSGTVYLALYTSNPTQDNSGTECSGGAYVRKAISFGSPSEVSEKQVISNDAAVDFGEQTTDIGTVSHWAIFSAETAGTMLWYGEFDQSKAVYSGDSVEVAIGEIDCILS